MARILPRSAGGDQSENRTEYYETRLILMTINRPKAAVSWSGGKDSCAALERSRDAFDIVAALTMVDEPGTRSRSHGIRVELMRAQSEALGLRHVMRSCDWSSYEQEFENGLRELAADGVTHVIYGDIIYPEHRAWAERLSDQAGVVAVEPLFGIPTSELAAAFVRSGARATIVAANAALLESSWLGTELSDEAVARLVSMGVDPCGENGEYHTFVTWSPSFARPVDVALGEVVQVRGYWAVDLTAPPATALTR
jgi:diphthine-ammonia ligase